MFGQRWTHASDRDLVNALIENGDEAAFRELYSRYTPRLMRIVGNVLENDSESEDVVQETWLRASAALRTFRWGSALSTWLAAIALNRAREVLRSRKRWGGPSDSQELAAPVPSLSERIDLERAVSMLPAGYRSVYELYDVEGYSHDEIARRLGIAPGTSKSQLFHARRSLRAFLEPLTSSYA